MTDVSCPICGESDHTASVMATAGGRYHCGHCNSLFHGGDDEWASNTFRRGKYAAERLARISRHNPEAS